ncbi:hypothetical protein IV203_027870 [Nitzschia inconspicua]|uniref:Uncharacterized protein n=1 Tax=Nitzschia inconspicua TaxID=303405 RepID=A0A9K3Q6G3_9STRA|nr:hypothetical protein IV203_027870 [Nitzschia inconspicua]
MELMDSSTTRDDQDEIWGDVINAVDDDSVWAANDFDDFSVSVYKKSESNPIVPTVVQKKAVPISRKSNGSTTPATTRQTLSSAQHSKSRGRNGKAIQSKKSSGKDAKSSQIKTPENVFSYPTPEFHQKWTVPIESMTSNEVHMIIPNKTNCTSDSLSIPLDDKFINHSHGDNGTFFSEEKVEPYDGFDAVMSEKLHKSHGDLPSKDIEDLMQSPLDFLIAMEIGKKNEAFRKNADLEKSWGQRSDFNYSNHLDVENIIGKRGKRNCKCSDRRVDKSPSQNRFRRSRSMDNKKEKVRKDRSRSRGAVHKDSCRDRSRRSDTITGQPKKSKDENRYTDRTSKKEDNSRRSRSVLRSSCNSPKRTSQSCSRSIQNDIQTLRAQSSRRSRSRSSSSNRKNSNNGKISPKDNCPEKYKSSRRPRSRSSSHATLSHSSKERKKDHERSTRKERSFGLIQLCSKSPSRSVSPNKRIGRKQRGSDRRAGPKRSKSDDLLDLLGASLGDLDKLGISFEPSLRVGLDSAGKRKFYPERKRLSRVKSMTITTSSSKNHQNALGNDLSRVDKKSEKALPGKSDEIKSTGDASSCTSSTKRSSGSSRGSVVSDAEQAQRLIKEQAKLVREQRKAEEAKLKRLQEESRLLEVKTRSEEMRLKALKEQAKLLDAKRVEEQARARVEAKVAQEQRKIEETRKKQTTQGGSVDSRDPRLEVEVNVYQ